MQNNLDFLFNLTRKSGKNELFEVHIKRAVITQLENGVVRHISHFLAYHDWLFHSQSVFKKLLFEVWIYSGIWLTSGLWIESKVIKLAESVVKVIKLWIIVKCGKKFRSYLKYRTWSQVCSIFLSFIWSNDSLLLIVNSGLKSFEVGFFVVWAVQWIVEFRPVNSWNF